MVGVVLGTLHVKSRKRHPQVLAVGPGEHPLTVQLLLVVPIPVEVQTFERFRFARIDPDLASASLSAAVSKSDTSSKPEDQSKLRLGILWH